MSWMVHLREKASVLTGRFPGAELVLYEGSCLEPKKNGGYEGVTVLSREGRTEK